MGFHGVKDGGLESKVFRLLPRSARQEFPPKPEPPPYLSSILGELKVNIRDYIGIVVPQKG